MGNLIEEIIIITEYEKQIKPRGEDEIWEYRTHGVYKQNTSAYFYSFSRKEVYDSEAIAHWTLDLHIPTYNKETRGFYKNKDEFYHIDFFMVYCKILIALNPHWIYSRILRFMFTLRKIVVSNIPESEIEQMVIEILSNYLESKTIDFQMHYPFEHPNMIAKNKEGIKPIKEYLE